MLSQVNICLTASRSCRLGYNALTKRWCTAAHTLDVKKNIEKTREKAYLGGGQKRIDKQHKKVRGNCPASGRLLPFSLLFIGLYYR